VSEDIPLNKLGAPDLQQLVERAGRRHAASIGEQYDLNPFTRPAHQGGYQHISPDEWRAFDEAMACWHEERRLKGATIRVLKQQLDQGDEYARADRYCTREEQSPGSTGNGAGQSLHALRAPLFEQRDVF
jgi:hypothetical protein